VYSLEGTAWDIIGAPGYTLGFYAGNVYICEGSLCVPGPNSLIINLLIISIFDAGRGTGATVSGFASSLIGIGSMVICTDYCVPAPIIKKSDYFPSSLSFNDDDQLENLNEMIDGVLELIGETE